MVIKHREVSPKCPRYSSNLKKCPSSKEVLSNEDLQNLVKHCTGQFETCKIFIQSNEKAA